MKITKVAIVGAGMTGCLLAHFLELEGLDVSIFEKSADCGGRVSNKQTSWGQFDLGATVVPAQNTDFLAFMQGLCHQNIATQWPENIFVQQQNTDIKPPLAHFSSDREYYVFNKKMNAACRHWIKNANLHCNSLISQVRYIEAKGWQLKLNNDWSPAFFDKVVLTAPWPHTQELIKLSELPMVLPGFSQSWTSCWSIALKLQPLVASDIDLVYLQNQPTQTLVRDSSKPSRPQIFITEADGNSEIWVAQLANKVSDELGKLGKDKAIYMATKALCELFDLPIQSVTNTDAHYWQYARPSKGQQPLGILSHKHGVYAGGDWSYGASIESTYEAALALSQAITTGE